MLRLYVIFPPSVVAARRLPPPPSLSKSGAYPSLLEKKYGKQANSLSFMQKIVKIQKI